MSLVGSEVNVSIDMEHPTIVSNDDEDLDHEEDAYLHSLPGRFGVDPHPSLTPPRPAEMLFVGVDTQFISAAALAQQIHNNRRRNSFQSVATEDFASATGWSSVVSPRPMTPTSATSNSHYYSSYSHSFDDEQFNDVFQKDVLSKNHQPIIAHSTPEEETLFRDTMMGTKATTATIPVTGPKKTFPESSSATTSASGSAGPDLYVDAAEKVYDTAKGVWAWGKGVIIFSPFLGIAEAVAGKVADMTGNTLESVDHIVVDQLHAIDDRILNPAIRKLVETLVGAAGKTEETLKPVIAALLKPFGILIKNQAENPETHVD
jgi:hypothetical protein